MRVQRTDDAMVVRPSRAVVRLGWGIAVIAVVFGVAAAVTGQWLTLAGNAGFAVVGAGIARRRLTVDDRGLTWRIFLERTVPWPQVRDVDVQYGRGRIVARTDTGDVQVNAPLPGDADDRRDLERRLDAHRDHP